MTRVNNAMTQYIGQTDSSLGTSQRLVAGLNSLADNFSTAADFALQLASVIAGALVGRSIVAMIAKVGVATEALVAFGRAIAAARTIGMASAFGSLGAAAGPLGAIIGGVLVGSLVLFSSRADDASKGAKSYAQALKIVQDAANKAAEAVDNASGKIDEQEKNSLTAGVKTGTGEIEASRQAAVDLIEKMIEAGQALTIVRDETGKMSRQPLATPEQLAQLSGLRDGLKAGSIEAAAVKDALFAMANSNPKFQKMADQMSPLLDALRDAVAATGLLKDRLGNLGSGPSFRQSENDSMAAYQAMKEAGDKFIADAQKRNALTKDQLALETEIAKVRNEALKAGVTLSEKQIKAIAEANVAADKRRSEEGKKTRETDYERLTKRIQESTAAQIAENEALARANPLIEDYGFNLAKARAEADLLNAAHEDGREITPALTAEIEKLATKYAQSVSAGNRLADVQDRIRQEAEDMADMMKGTFTDMVDALFEAGDMGQKLIGIFANVGRSYANLNVKEMWENI
jgi:hypothetical protein